LLGARRPFQCAQCAFGLASNVPGETQRGLGRIGFFDLRRESDQISQPSLDGAGDQGFVETSRLLGIAALPGFFRGR
jgi:hypothetical protein